MILQGLRHREGGLVQISEGSRAAACWEGEAEWKQGDHLGLREWCWDKVPRLKGVLKGGQQESGMQPSGAQVLVSP